MRPRRATIGDVASLAGVSPATVSRVLNGTAQVTPATREAVEKAMAEVGFRASRQAQSLAFGRADEIAVVLTEPFDVMYEDPTYSAILRGVNDALLATPLVPVLFQISTAAEQAKALRLMARQVVDAVIHLSPFVDDGFLAELRDVGLPTVLCGQLLGDPYGGAFSTIYADDVLGATLVGNHVMSLGRKRLGVVMGEPGHPASKDRIAGIRASCAPIFDPELVVYGGWGTADGLQGAAELLDRAPDIDALICGSDRIASGALSVLSERGRRVPEDVAVTGFDNHPIALTTNPPLTTVAQPMRRQGELAVTEALALLAGGQPRTTVLPMELVVRASA